MIVLHLIQNYQIRDYSFIPNLGETGNKFYQILVIIYQDDIVFLLNYSDTATDCLILYSLRTSGIKLPWVAPHYCFNIWLEFLLLPLAPPLCCSEAAGQKENMPNDSKTKY